MQAKLVVVSGESRVSEYLVNLPATLGRSRNADVTLGHPLVSRQHCEIVAGDDGVLLVRDLGSLNGTFIGELRLTEELTQLPPGGLLTVGSVTFRAVYGDAEDAASGETDDQLPDFAPADSERTLQTGQGGNLDEAAGAAEPEHDSHAAAEGAAGFDFNWLEDDAEGGAESAGPPALPIEDDVNVEELANDGKKNKQEQQVAKPAKQPAEAEEKSEHETLPVEDQADDPSEFAPRQTKQHDDEPEDNLDDFFQSLQ